ncbi:MAG: glutamate--tRNA ligase, partial [Candidatus Baldrarchaeia archaeon]
EQGHAYVCLCKADEWRIRYKIPGKPCPHRKQTVEENLEHWEKMLSGEYSQGEAVVRLKTGMNHPDPAMRDHIIMRISEREHPRVGTKYRVWPLLEFSWGIDDHLLGVTHILRGKDLIKEDMMEEFIWKLFNWPRREFIHYGKILFKGITLSKRKARKFIEEGVYRGWDDPRTWSLQSLAKRGIKPEALRKAILDLGLSIVDIEYSPSNLYAYNRRLIDPIALRYFFVDNPVRLRIKNIPEEKIVAKPPLHPEKPELGYRDIPLTIKDGMVELFVSQRDLNLLKNGSIIRLKDLFNFKVTSVRKTAIEGEFYSWSVHEARRVKAPIIHWVPTENYVDIKVIMPDGNEIKGVGECNCRNLKVDQVVQFERFGFVRVDSVDEEVVCYYTHN